MCCIFEFSSFEKKIEKIKTEWIKNNIYCSSFICHLKLNKKQCDFDGRRVRKILFLCIACVCACVCNKQNVYLRFVRISDNRDKVSVWIVLFETHFRNRFIFFFGLFLPSILFTCWTLRKIRRHSCSCINISQGLSTLFLDFFLFRSKFFVKVQLIIETNG